MKMILLAIAMMVAAPSFAQAPPASEASIRELLSLTDAHKLLDGAYDQIDSLMNNAANEALGGNTLTAEQDKLMAEWRSETMKLIREEMSWEKLEPVYIKLYKDTFSQSDIEGMLAFYKTGPGQAVLKKMPLLTQNLMQMLVSQMRALTPKLHVLSEQYVSKLKAAK